MGEKQKEKKEIKVARVAVATIDDALSRGLQIKTSRSWAHKGFKGESIFDTSVGVQPTF